MFNMSSKTNKAEINVKKIINNLRRNKKFKDLFCFLLAVK